MSTMLSFSDHSLGQFLSEEELFNRCPAAFVTEPTNPNVSESYVQATTIDVIRDMAKLGWYPVDAKQCKKTKKSTGVRSFHLVAFQNEDARITLKDGETEAYVRIILTNSHDGFNSFKFMCGLYRLVCSNGCVVSDEEFEHVQIRHINYNFAELRETITAMLERIPAMTQLMNRMAQTILTPEQKEKLAVETYKIRKQVEAEKEVKLSQLVIDSILNPVRDEDKKDDLWTVFNICQEKMIRGGFDCETKKGKLRKQRGITSIKKDADYNQKLWNVAASFVPNYCAA